MADVLTPIHDFDRVYQSGNPATILFHGERRDQAQDPTLDTMSKRNEKE